MGNKNSGRKEEIFIRKEELNRLYWKEKKSLCDIAKIFNCYYKTIFNRMVKYNIPRRSVSEAKKGCVSPNKGKSFSKNHREKISKANKGRVCSFKGHLHTIETRKRISETKKRYYKDKTKHPNWQGGVSFEHYGIEFNKVLKKQIRKRDNYRCQECFRHQDEVRTKTNKHYKLIIHHIDYNKKNNNPKNLISLCRNCHIQTNYSRDDWSKYFKEIMCEVMICEVLKPDGFPIMEGV